MLLYRFLFERKTEITQIDELKNKLKQYKDN